MNYAGMWKHILEEFAEASHKGRKRRTQLNDGLGSDNHNLSRQTTMSPTARYAIRAATGRLNAHFGLAGLMAKTRRIDAEVAERRAKAAENSAAFLARFTPGKP